MKTAILYIFTLLVVNFCFVNSCSCNKEKNKPRLIPRVDITSATPTLKAITDRGVLRVGMTGDYQPMSYLDSSTETYVGFDAEFAKDIAKALNVQLEFVPTTWTTLMDDTLAGKFDMAISGIDITDERKETALMSDGYITNGKTVLCRKEDANKYTSLEAINQPGVKVMENPGGSNEDFANENLPNAELIIHEVNQEIPGLIANGKADVMITEIMEAGYYAKYDSRLAAPLIYEPFTNGELGVLMPKGSDDLLDYVNQFILEERSSERLDELAEKYIYGKLINGNSTSGGVMRLAQFSKYSLIFKLFFILSFVIFII